MLLFLDLCRGTRGSPSSRRRPSLLVGAGDFVGASPSTAARTFRLLALLSLGLFLALLPTKRAEAEEVPADRRPLVSPTRAAEDGDTLILPGGTEDTPDAGDRDWASTDAQTIIREAHLRRVAGAYGLSASFAGMSMTSLLIAHTQTDPDFRRGWRYAAITTGGVSAIAFTTATILWATTPPAPGQRRLAAHPTPTGLALTLTFY